MKEKPKRLRRNINMEQNLMENVADVTEETVDAVAESRDDSLAKIAGITGGAVAVAALGYGVVKLVKFIKSKKEKKDDKIVETEYAEETVENATGDIEQNQD